MDSLYIYYIGRHELAKAEKIVEGMVLEHPTDHVYYERAAMLSGELANNTKAIAYFEKASDLSTNLSSGTVLICSIFKTR